MKIHKISNGTVKTVLSINNRRHISNISKKTETTYSHTVNIINELEERGFLGKNKKGRVVIVKLTEKGEILKQKLEEIQSLYEIYNTI